MLFAWKIELKSSQGFKEAAYLEALIAVDNTVLMDI